MKLTGADEDAAPALPKLNCGGRHEGRQVEPAVDGAAADGQVAVRDAVGPVAAAAGGIGDRAARVGVKVIAAWTSTRCRDRSSRRTCARTPVLTKARPAPKGRS